MEFQPHNLDQPAPAAASGVRVALPGRVAETSTVTNERRGVAGTDRRKKSRGGRRTTDPHNSWRWRRLAWLFAAYAVYWSVRTLP